MAGAVGGGGVEVGVGVVARSRASSVATLSSSALTSLLSALLALSVEILRVRAVIRLDRLSSVIGDCACSCETPSANRRTMAAPSARILCLCGMVAPPRWIHVSGGRGREADDAAADRVAPCAQPARLSGMPGCVSIGRAAVTLLVWGSGVKARTGIA